MTSVESDNKLYYHSYDNHRYLHSFPTRRSSDLIPSHKQVEIQVVTDYLNRYSGGGGGAASGANPTGHPHPTNPGDRKSTRLNSSHSSISYAVFCLKKKRGKGITHLIKKIQLNI